MQKLIPVDSAVEENDFPAEVTDTLQAGEISSESAGYMKGDKYHIVTGWGLIEAARVAGERLVPIHELYTPVERGLEYHVTAIRDNHIGSGASIYHPVMVRGFETSEVTRPTMERYNMVIKGLADFMPTFGGVSLVDLGCHHGYWSFSLEAAGFNVLGVDNVPASLVLAGNLKKLLASEVQFRILEIGRDGAFAQVILAMNVLHHVVDGLSSDGIRKLLLKIAINTREILIVSYREKDLGQYADPRTWPGFDKDPILLGNPRGSYPVWMLCK